MKFANPYARGPIDRFTQGATHFADSDAGAFLSGAKVQTALVRPLRGLCDV